MSDADDRMASGIMLLIVFALMFLPKRREEG